MPSARSYGSKNSKNSKTSGSASVAQDMVGLPELENKFGHLFKDLCVRTDIETEFGVINCIITYDSKHTVVISIDERQKSCQIMALTLTDNKSVFLHTIKGTWVVMSEIE